jgi:hypothetical protein
VAGWTKDVDGKMLAALLPLAAPGSLRKPFAGPLQAG